MRQLAFLLLAAWCAFAQVPTPERWLEHFRNDLLRFWDMPDALGTPLGSFPTLRCDDGRRYDIRLNPCPEVRNSAWGTMDRQYAVALSRQTYGYGVAFHLTGERRFLEYMKAGVDYLRANVYDRSNGGAHAYWDGATRSWQPAVQHRNPQELAYAMLGTAMYYYLTRDAEVLPDLLAMKDYVFGQYYNAELGALQWMLADQGNTRATEKRVTATLDQMNAFMVLLAPILPEPHASEWKQSLFHLSRMLADQFYASEHNLFWVNATTARDMDLSVSSVDFGHTIKAFWMIRFVGLMNNDQELVRFAEQYGPLVLERAWLDDTGSWASSITPQGINKNKEWWIYAELDQFAATMALKDPSMTRYLERSYDYWFRYIVDPVDGEVWTAVHGETHRPMGTNPKVWPWKNAYHSTEHALVGYITSAQLHERPVELYYAIANACDSTAVRPYFYSGDSLGCESSEGIQKVTFTPIR